MPSAGWRIRHKYPSRLSSRNKIEAVAYSLSILPDARKDLDALPLKRRRQVEQRILRLAEDPFPPDAKSLKGKQFAGLHRVRSGDYRIIYQVERQKLLVLVVKVGNRKDVYR